MSRTIGFLRIAASHNIVKLERTSQNVTVHKGQWAVCAARRPDGHVWQETNGINYDDLFEKRLSRKDAN
jgi:hypothetical protein